MRSIDLYIQASGADPAIKAEFEALAASLDIQAEDEIAAAIQIKEKLTEKGFSYNPKSFTLQDVIRSNSGNCLGHPLLVACLLDHFGYEPEFQLVIRPQDVAHKLETEFYDHLVYDMPFDYPRLAEEEEEFPTYRFMPLEHLTLDLGGMLMETTSPEHTFPGAESYRKVTLKQALSGVYKDRATHAMCKGFYEKGKELAMKGLESWEDNRQIHSLLALFAPDYFDDEVFESSLERMKELDGDDSLFHCDLYAHTGEAGHLNTALEKYPAFASAIACKAKNEEDPDEARYLYAIASHLHAKSQNLSLPGFYIAHAKKLGELFGEEKIAGILEDCGDNFYGTFNYHMALYGLTADQEYLREAKEALNQDLPMERLRFAIASRGTVFFDQAELDRLEAEYANSRLYQNAKRELETA